MIIRRLCEEAPAAADALATTIRETSKGISNFPSQEQDIAEKGTGQVAQHKRMSNKDLTYRPSSSAKAKVAENGATGNPGLPEESQVLVDHLLEDSAAKGVPTSVQNAGDITLRDEIDEVGPTTSSGLNAEGLRTLRQEQSRKERRLGNPRIGLGLARINPRLQFGIGKGGNTAGTSFSTHSERGYFEEVRSTHPKSYREGFRETSLYLWHNVNTRIEGMLLKGLCKPRYRLCTFFAHVKSRGLCSH